LSRPSRNPAILFNLIRCTMETIGDATPTRGDRRGGKRPARFRLHARADADAAPLLLLGGAIWLTNVIVFALWYWEFDRGGPVARAHAHRDHPDFLFPQMQAPEFATDDWEPGFADYFYLSFTNATAFSPTDVLPMTAWTKMTMLVQSVVSLTTVALVIARAVNILK